MPPQNSLPRDDEIEVSVFGPGYGESLLIHVGKGCWIAVDSCIDHASRRPRPLRYLEALDVDPNTAIHIVVASHWHDDHIRGMHELFKAASSACFICSVALTGVEFLALADLYASDSSHTTRGPRELYRCLTEVAAQGKSSGRQILRWAIADRPLWVDTTINVRLTALSPSDEMNRRSLAFMAQALAAIKRGANEDRLIESSPNDVAVALRLDVQDRAILLGSDLEEEGNLLVGWSAVLDSVAARERRSTMFKVAHHGSKSGHHDGVWRDLLDHDPLSLLTPFRWGRHRIPTPDDRARILTLTNRAFISAHPERLVKPKRRTVHKAEDLINRTARNRRQVPGPVGHIRWRAPIFEPNSEGSLDLFDGAMALADVN